MIGYICSSDRMRKAYKRRPHDFKRRILNLYNSITHKELLDKEQEWLQLIPDHDLGIKYYNLNKTTGHWSAENNRNTILEKVSRTMKIKNALLTPEERSKKFGIRRGVPSPFKGVTGRYSEETIEKIRQATIKQNRERIERGEEFPLTPHQFKKGQPSLNKGKKASEETRKKISEAQTGKIRGPRTDNVKQKIGEKNRENMKRLWADPSYRAMMLEARKKKG